MPDPAMSDLLLLNGPNLGILGRRQTEIYGRDSLLDIERVVRAEVAGQGWGVIAAQHNAEGQLIDTIEKNYGTVGAIVNPGALMIAGWGLRDALANYPRPWIEVHLSNLWARETFRHESVIAALASGVIVGFGSLGYRLAARALLEMTSQSAAAGITAGGQRLARRRGAGSARPDPELLLDGQ
jgi:5-deoxy-5-amino-3-dehydroquinate dehydratase